MVWREPARPEHRRLLDWHRALIALRKRLPDLSDGRLEATCVQVDEEARWLTMTRGRVLVACNLAETAQSVPCAGAAAMTMVLVSQPGAEAQDDALLLPGHAVAILTTAREGPG